MAAAITVLIIEFILLCLMPFAYFNIGLAWAVVAGMIGCAIVGGVILPGAISGIKTRTPSRGKAIATTAMAGIAIAIGATMALSMLFIVAVLRYVGL